MNYRSLLVALMFAALAVPAAAQEAPRGSRGPGGFQRGLEAGERVGQRQGSRLERLQETLGLTEAQIVAIEALQAAHRETLQGLNASQREARQNVQSLIEQDASATDIGEAVLAAHAIRETVKAANEQFRADFNNVLTLAQQEQLAEIREAAAQVRGLGGFPGRRGCQPFRGRRPASEG